ncbi:glutamate-rich protein 2 [Eulemur rufifrons]|uniref:glutamate-rich protein 2 n=1 Tax=Eulemur rufifrons TaxID=859984 RepID=UPI0037431C30
MDTHIPICLPSALLKVAGACAPARPTAPASNSQRGGTLQTARLSLNPDARPAPPPHHRSPAPPRNLPSPPASPCALHRSQGSARPIPAPPPLPRLAQPPPNPLGLYRPPLPRLQLRAALSPWQRGVPGSWLQTRSESRAGLAFGVCPSDGRLDKATSGNYVDKTNAVKAPKNRQTGRLLVFDPKEKVMMEPNEAMSDKCLFGYRPRLASKLYASSTQVSLNVVKTFSEKKEVSSKNIENKVSLKNTENRVSSKNIENKDILNLQSDLWSSSFLKESTGEVDKEAVIAKQEKNNEYCLQNIDDKLSESVDDDDTDNTSDEDNDEDSNPKKDTCAPLELMAEFLRAEMGRDYHLAKKLCQMILIYEPENPEAKEFLALIEEMLLMEKSQNLKKDDEDSEEDSSSESEEESSEDPNDESSDEGEDGS